MRQDATVICLIDESGGRVLWQALQPLLCSALSFCSPSVCNINEISLLTSDFPSRDNVSMGGAGWLALRFCPWLQVLVPDFGNWFALEIT